MKNIGIFHYKVGGTDGVSLEIDKWKQVLEEMGHRVYLCAGDLGTTEGTLIKEMYHLRPDATRLYRNTFLALQDYDESVYAFELEHLADEIKKQLRWFIAQNNIDYLIPQNIWSVAANPSVALALRRIMLEFDLPTLAHHHDFYWERMDGVALSCSTAVALADKYLPPRDPQIHHVVINSLAQQELFERKGLESTIVPNVFDFADEPWREDDYNEDFRAEIGLSDGDVVILQATRIVPRKSIELAVDFVKVLSKPERRARLQKQGLYDGRDFSEESRIVLVLAGYAYDDLTGHYIGRLKQKIADTGVDAIFIDDRVASRRRIVDDKKIYSLWDTYVLADFVTYPSLEEGWGNQLLETLRACLPFLIYEYPVYKADIKDKGFRAVSLGSELIGRDEQDLAMVEEAFIERAADEALELLIDSHLRQSTVEHNLRIAQEHYSMDALRRYLKALVGIA